MSLYLLSSGAFSVWGEEEEKQEEEDEEEEEEEEGWGARECSHGLYTLSIEELLSGREIKDERQVRRHPDGRKDRAKRKTSPCAATIDYYHHPSFI